MTDTEATFYDSGQKMAMMPPVVRGNKLVMRFATADGYIQLDKKSASELSWTTRASLERYTSACRLANNGCPQAWYADVTGRRITDRRTGKVTHAATRKVKN